MRDESLGVCVCMLCQIMGSVLEAGAVREFMVRESWGRGCCVLDFVREGRGRVGRSFLLVRKREGEGGKMCTVSLVVCLYYVT